MSIRFKNVLNNVSWMVVGRFFQLAVTFVATMLITRYLGPEKYGLITHANSYVQVLIPISTLGINDVITKLLIEKKEQNDLVLGSTILMRIASSSFSILVLLITMYCFHGNDQLFTAIVFESFSLFFQAFDSIVYWFQSKLMAKKVGIILILTYTVTAAFRIVGLITNKDIKWFSFAISLDYIVLAVLLFTQYLKSGNNFRFDKTVAAEILKLSSNYLFASIMIAIYSRADTIFLGNLVDDISVGYYSAATTICNAWPFVLIAIIEITNPIIVQSYSRSKEEFETRLKQLYAIVFYIGIAVAVFITIFGKYIILIVYGKDYMPAVLPFKIASWSTVFAYLGVARASWMQCENRLKYEKRISFIGAIINIVLNYLLIRHYGAVGAASALVLTQFITNVVLIFMIKETRDNAKLMLNAIILKGILK